MCSVFKLFWLSRYYLPNDWLERLLWGSITLARDHLHKAQAEECLIVLVYCILSLFNCMIFLYCPPALRDILLTSMAWYGLFVLKVPLNTKQANKQTRRTAAVHFLAWLMSYIVTHKTRLSLSCLVLRFCWVCFVMFTRATLIMSCYFVFFVFCLLVVLVRLPVPVQLTGKTFLWSDLCCVDGLVKPYSVTY